MVIEYAHALAKSTEGTSKDQAKIYVARLVEILKREGKLKALPQILREFKRIIEQRNAKTPTLTVAQKKDAANATKELKAILKEAVVSDSVVDDSIIGGWRYVGRDTLVDNSYKTALIDLYRNITRT